MITLHGIPASPGVAIGPAWLYQKVQLAAYEELSRLTAQAEQRRFDCAVQEARAQLDRLYEKTVREAGEAAAQIFDIHKMMMEDLDYLESVEDNITNQLYTAEHAVACAGQEFAEMFASMDDEVMRARSADIRDITQRLLQVLTGGQSQALKESSVVCAHDLFPSDTMQLEREHVMAFVTELGSHVSHSAILARTMGIPAVVGVGGLVEVPSAAILADQFAQEVDFFSIGTNDLTQYTLAADRLNDKVADLFDSSHPAVLRLIQNTAQAAAARGIWCGICGESAGNEALLPFYIKAGVRELSVVPGKVLELRRALSAIDASTL